MFFCFTLKSNIFQRVGRNSVFGMVYPARICIPAILGLCTNFHFCILCADCWFRTISSAVSFCPACFERVVPLPGFSPILFTLNMGLNISFMVKTIQIHSVIMRVPQELILCSVLHSEMEIAFSKADSRHPPAGSAPCGFLLRSALLFPAHRYCLP